MLDIAKRRGPKPRTTTPVDGEEFIHKQLSAISPIGCQTELLSRADTLPYVVIAPSCISVPGARGLFLEGKWSSPRDAFMRDREFCHLHPPDDGSLHLTLPSWAYETVLEAGWGEPHPLVGTMLLFGPRNEAEVEVVWQIVDVSYRYACGADGVG